jgi:hypothetical protein
MSQDKLTKLARGQPCEIRVPGICNHDPETTVACHFRLSGISGIGLKAPSLFIAFGCSACHEAVDGRRQTDFTRGTLHLMHAEGVFRTQARLIDMGVIKW